MSVLDICDARVTPDRGNPGRWLVLHPCNDAILASCATEAQAHAVVDRLNDIERGIVAPSLATVFAYVEAAIDARTDMKREGGVAEAHAVATRAGWSIVIRVKVKGVRSTHDVHGEGPTPDAAGRTLVNDLDAWVSVIAPRRKS